MRTLLAILALGLALGGAWWLARDERGGAESAARNAAEAPEPAGRAEPETDPLAPPPAEREAPPAPPGDPVRSVTVRVTTSESFAQDAQLVGGIAFEVFAQEEPAGALPGELFAPLALGADAVPLARGRTDERGEALVELPRARLRCAENGLPRVCGRVVEAGHQARTVNGLQAKDAAVCELRLMVRRGATARGRVVDAQGRPLAAEVRLRSWSAPRGERQLGSGTRARMLAEGAFEIDYDEPVVDGVLWADAGAAGTGARGGLALTLEAPPQDLQVTVTGPGVVRGRVLDGAGAPAAGLELFVLLAALDDERGTTVLPVSERSRLEAEGGGRLWQALQTGRDGAFEVRGLRAEPCVVRARTQAQSGYPHLLTPVPVRPDGSELVLRLARPHLVVRFLDERGEPWSGARPESPRPSLFPTLRQEWPAAPIALVFRAKERASAAPLVDERIPGKPTAAAELVFEVSAGARYLVGAYGAGFDGALREVEVLEGSSAVPVELRARALGEPGTLLVRLFSAGAELRGGRGLEVGVEGLPSAVLLLEGERYGDEYPYRFRAPPGRYRVFAQGVAETDFQHGILWHPRALGRAEREVEVRAGATQELVLTLDAGARLEVSLVGTACEADVQAMRTRNAWLADPERADLLAAKAAEAELFLERPGQRPEPVPFSAQAWQGTSAEGLHLIDGWPLGKTQLSEVLPSGRSTLVARLPGGRERRVELELLEGVTTKVTLDF